MARILAAFFFVAAAFAWSLPWLDRPGAAALGFACLSLAVGRGSAALRPSLFRRLRDDATAAPTVEPSLAAVRDEAPSHQPEYL